MESQLQLAPLQCNADIVHCKLLGEDDFYFNNFVVRQTMDNSPREIDNGSRCYSYVPEEVQNEVDRISDTQEFGGNETLKDSVPEDYMEVMMSTITPQLGELLSLDTLTFDVINNLDNCTQLPAMDIHDNCLSESTNIFVLPDISQKDDEPSLNSSLARSPNVLPSGMKRKPAEGNEKLPKLSTLAPKKKCLYDEAPFKDKVKEKKRRDAIRAKKNRDNKKDFQSLLQEERDARVKLEREVADLKKEVQEMKSIIQAMRSQS